MIFSDISDKKKFEQFYKSYFVELTYFTYKFVQDNDVAQDIVQSFFLDLYDQKHKIHCKTSLKSYAYQSVKNRAINHLKHINFVESSLEKYWEEEYNNLIIIDDNFQDKQQINLEIKRAIESLPPKCRRILIMNTINGLKYTEIASLLGISVNTVKTQVCIAYKILRIELKGCVLCFFLFVIDIF